MKIIAIGGGGFTHGSEPNLDDFCLSETKCDRPRMAFIGTASDDDPLKIERFRTRFHVQIYENYARRKQKRAHQ